jgi:hypothetical protein
MAEPIAKSTNKMSKEQQEKYDEGRCKIAQAQNYYNAKIEKAPVRSGYNRFTGKYDDNKSAMRRAKNDYIKEIVGDYALFGINILDEDAMKTLEGE